MLLRYMSDLHFEFGHLDFLQDSAFFSCDALVLAGDICVLSKKGSVLKLRKLLKVFNKPIFYVPGNHEFYHNTISQTLFALSQLSEQFPHFHVLHNSYLDFDQYRILGTTLWTDLEHIRTDFVKLCAIAVNINDFKNIFIDDENLLSLDSVAEFGKQAKQFLLSNLSPLKTNIVITHFAPSSISLQHDDYENLIHEYYFSNCEEIIHSFSNIPLWFHGHTHVTNDYFIGRTRILSNTRGYLLPRNNNPFNLEYDNPYFNPLSAVELP